jgi:hypothetical protein
MIVEQIDQGHHLHDIFFIGTRILPLGSFCPSTLWTKYSLCRYGFQVVVLSVVVLRICMKIRTKDALVF